MRHLFQIALLLLVTNAHARNYPERIQLQFSFTHEGQFMCAGQPTLNLGEEYLLCERKRDNDSTVVLKTEVWPQANGHYLVKALLETIGANSEVTPLSSPRINTMANEPAEITVSETDGAPTPTLKFSVLIHKLKTKP